MIKSSVKYKQIWNIAIPIIIGSIAQNILNVTDTAFLGRVGEVELGASAIGGLLYYVFMMLGFGYGVGTQIIIARRNGEGRLSEIGQTARNSFYFLIILAIISFLFVRYYSPVLLNISIDSASILEKSNEYLYLRSIGFFFVFTNIAFRSLYIGIEKTRVIIYATVIIAGINIILDYFLIFGKFGFEEMGIRGAALASVIAELAGSIFLLSYSLSRKYLKKYWIFKYSSFSLNLFKSISKTALPVMLQNFVSLSGWFIFFLFVEKMGEHNLAISNIIRNAYIVLLIPVWGFAAASNTLVSNTIGKNKHREVLHLAFKIAGLCFVVVLFFAVVSLGFAKEIMSIFTNNQSLINDSVPVFYIVTGSSLFIAIGIILFNAVSGTGRTLVALFIETGVILTYLLYVWLNSNITNNSIEMVWTAEYVYGFSLGLVSLLYLIFGKWGMKKI